MLDRNLLYDWYKSRAKPKQDQFYAWINACFLKGEKLPLADVDGLEDTLNNFQASLNSIIPNTLVSGGQVSIVSDDGTNIVVHIPDTEYKLKKVPFSIAAQDVTIIRPNDPALSRFDVFYLDDSGFHVLTGTLSATPVKPQIASGIELTSMLVGFDNGLELIPGSSDVTKAYVDAADEDLQEQIDNISLTPGVDGKSAYEVAVNNGFVGTETEWLASLEGQDGADSTVPGPEGDSAYQVAVNNGFVGTEAEWLASLKGEPGDAGTGGEVDSVASDLFMYYNF